MNRNLLFDFADDRAAEEFAASMREAGYASAIHFEEAAAYQSNGETRHRPAFRVTVALPESATHAVESKIRYAAHSAGADA